MTEETVGHKESECPICKGELEYDGESDIGEGGVSYGVFCTKCNATGAEWHDMKFSEVRMQPRSE